VSVDKRVAAGADPASPVNGATHPTRAEVAAAKLQTKLSEIPAVPDPAGDAPSGVGVLNIANVLTMFRIALVPVFAVFLFVGDGHETGWRIAAWGAYATAAMTDRLDGQIARARGLVTEFGKLADPIADKALVGVALIGLSVLGDLSWWVTIVVLAREVGVTLLRFWVLRHGVIPASRGGKLKTLLLNVGIGLYVLPLSGALHVVASVILGVAVAVAIVTAVDYVGTALDMRRKAGHPTLPVTADESAPGGLPASAASGTARAR
jgi:CDP-diacylglycerol---glycerol-3-phosphate 3-phosphatidyltransferase